MFPLRHQVKGLKQHEKSMASQDLFGIKHSSTGLCAKIGEGDVFLKHPSEMLSVICIITL